jgi:hypothetical protein
MATISTSNQLYIISKSNKSGYTSITIEGDIVNGVLEFYWANGSKSDMSEANSHLITADANGSLFSPVAEGVYTIGPLPQGRLGVKATTLTADITVEAYSVS